MDRLIYTVLTGMRARAAAQAVTANNLANAGTTGFRRELSSLASRYLNGPADTARVQSDDAVSTSLLEPGSVDVTGQPLDVAVSGSGWITVQAADGSEAYTRRGDLRVAPTGLLETGDGHPVIGGSGVITIPPATSVSIAADGTLSITAAGSPVPVIVDHLKLVDPPAATLHRGADTLFHSASEVDAAPAVRLTVGALEHANVDTPGALVELLEATRGFEMNVKLLGVARDLDEAGTKLMRWDG